MRLLESHQPGEPFHLYLKNYFARNRKHGSSDRRILRELCYAYFRIGQLAAERSIQERVAIAYYLIHPDPMSFLGSVQPDWPSPTTPDPSGRASAIGVEWKDELVFPWHSQVSTKIDAGSYTCSLLRQPDLFIRIRPGHEASVLKKLTAGGIGFRVIDQSCLALSNATDLESLLEIDREVVVQDCSSQRVGELMRLLPAHDHWAVWDACAASGGKSILLQDILPSVTLSCTDLRGNILRNLQARLGRAVVPVMRVRSDDLMVERDRSDWGMFDLILADVPCTGSGTWARTPEQAYYFDPASTEALVRTQRAILQQCVKQLLPGGYLLYMTCSVFASENEHQLQWIVEALGLELIEQRIFTGYAEKADTLFGALLKRSA